MTDGSACTSSGAVFLLAIRNKMAGTNKVRGIWFRLMDRGKALGRATRQRLGAALGIQI